MPPGNGKTRRRKRIGLAAAAGAAAVAAAVLVVRWSLAAPETPPLEAGWPAQVTTLAGGSATFSEPFGIAAGPGGVIYVTDGVGSHSIRRIGADGRVETIAGGRRGFADGQGAAARFDTPSALAIDASGVLLVADTGNHAIRRLTTDGVVTTLAGDGVAGDSDGTQARFNGPVGVAIETSGRVIVADTYNDRIRAIASDGMVTTIAGGPGPGADDGAAADARFDTPSGVSVDATGAIHVADTGNGAIRRIDTTGAVTTTAYDVEQSSMRPIAVASSADGRIYATDERGRVVEIDAAGQARTVAGTVPGFLDGRGNEAKFRRLAGLAVTAPGHLLVSDAGNAVVRTIVAVSRSRAQLPRSPLIVPHFDEETFARTPLLWPVSPMEGPHEIAGTIGEARGGPGGERFHAGIDVRIGDGTIVRAARDGSIASPISTGDFGTLNEWLRIGPLTYVHVRAGRERKSEVTSVPGFTASYDASGKLARVRVRRGTHYAAGDVIATVNPFNHVHLNVGWPGEEVNPLKFRLTRFSDTIAPVIATRGVTFHSEDWQPFPSRRRAPATVTGRVRIVVDAWDQVDGNRPSRRLGLYAIGYQVLLPDGSPVPGFEAIADRLVFDRLAVQPDAARLVYAPGSGIPFYGGRRTRFLYVATNTFRDGVAAEGFWDTRALPAGRYTVRIHARDIQGNAATVNRDCPVIVAK